ncbi:MAG: cellulase family glycosylhydrolase [bacterium]|nr:cellulase family glycosylhydrolase [bacterium]
MWRKALLKARNLAAILLAVVVCPVVSASPYGVVGHVPSEAVLEQIAAAGIEWVRVSMNWYMVEPEQDQFDWSIHDQVIEGAHRRGLKVFVTLAYTPQWATSGPVFQGVPNDPDDWRDFCYRAAARYRGKVAVWGMWNEPNLDGFWAGSRTEYLVEIMRPGAEAIRMADPRALVAGPELAHLSSGHWQDWLEYCIRFGADSLDVVTHHVYPSDSSASDVTRKLDEGGQYPWEPPSVKEVLRDTGWWGRPFWLAETGLRSTEFGESRQADFVEDLLETWFSPSRPSWVDRIFFYHIEDDPRFPDRSWGLLEPQPESRRKLAYDRYQESINSLFPDDAEFENLGKLVFAGPGDSFSATVRVRNTGYSTWTAAGGFELAVVGDEDGLIQAVEAFPSGVFVGPGDQLSFTVEVVIPSADPVSPDTTQTYEVALRMSGRGGYEFGDWHSVIAKASLYDPPRVVNHPEPQNVEAGVQARFSVQATGSDNLAFQWFRNGIELEDGPNIVGSKEAILEVWPESQSDTGEYLCRLRDRDRVVFSEPAELHLVESEAHSPRKLSAGRRVSH